MSGQDFRLGIVTGLAFEARIVRVAARALRQTPPLISCAGPGAARARAAAETLIAQGVTHLLSFGIAAGLDPELEPGATIIASEFRRAGSETLICDSAWGDHLAEVLPKARRAAIADSTEILATADAKSALYKITAAAVADMESYGVAQAAAAGHAKCAAVRVVSDRASHSVPLAATVGANPDGTVNGLAVMASILRRPWQFPALVRVAEGTRIAQKQLYTLADAGLARGFLAGLVHE